MKIVVFTRPDDHWKGGGLSIHSIDPTMYAALTETGFGWNESRIAWEIEKQTAPLGGLTEEFASIWVTALANGGKTDVEAFDLFVQWVSQYRGFSTYSICEDTDLPSDRYFRNAWEWSD